MLTGSFELPLTRRTLRKKFATVLVILNIALLCLLAVVAWQSLSTMRHDYLSKAQTLAANLSDVWRAAEPTQLRQMQNALMNTTSQASADLQAAFIYQNSTNASLVWRAKQQLVAASDADKRVQVRQAETRLNWTTLQVQVPIILQNGLAGNVRFEVTLRSWYQHLLQLFLFASVINLVLAMAAAYWLTQQALQAMSPLMELTVLAEKVATMGDYTVRAKPDSEHPLGNLLTYFNLMLARMEAWENDMQSEASERREAESRLSILNNHDSLTKLPNRHYFHRLMINCVEDALANQELAALMFIDIDNFKAVNEELGYDAGDQILAALAQRLSNVLRSTDNLCRVDGDEFAAILPQVGNMEIVQQLATRFMDVLQQTFVVRGQAVYLNACIGIACCPLHAREQRLFLHNADLALKAAKQQGHGHWIIYHPDLARSSLV